VSRMYLEGQHRGLPMLERGWLKGHTEGLIALSGGREGDLGRALQGGDPAAAKRRLTDWLELFPGRFYLELQRTGREGEEACLHDAVKLAVEFDVPVVATNDVRFLRRGEFEAHEARVCIQDGRTL